jgi:hypothetical protein
VLEVDLMHDAGRRRHHLEVVERLLAPAQEGVALLVAAELDRHVLVERGRLAEHVDLHRVVDHELGRSQRVDPVRVAAERAHGVAHRREIHHAGHAREILQHHARGHERDLGVGLALGVPVAYRLDLLRSHADAVLVAQQVLEQDLHGVGQALDREAFAQLREAVEAVALAAEIERRTNLEAVQHGTLLEMLSP